MKMVSEGHLVNLWLNVQKTLFFESQVCALVY